MSNKHNSHSQPSVPVVNDVIEHRIKSSSRYPNGYVKRYQKGKYLGRGGFATCYELISVDSKNHYAGKIIPRKTLAEQRTKAELLCNEINIHKELKHQNIVKFESFFEDKDNVYIILELCQHQTLMELVRRRQRLTEMETQRFMWQLLNGVEYLHKNNVIHRDLKLGNLFLNETMEIKIKIFGLAKKLSNALEKRKTMCGTPNYMAPEVLNSRSHEGHSFEVDVWSMGVIMYTMLVGKPPFESTNVEKTYDRIRAGDYMFPPEIDISMAAKRLVGKMLSPRPEQRPCTIDIRRDRFFIQSPFPKRISLSSLRSAPDVDAILESIRIEGAENIHIAETPGTSSFATNVGAPGAMASASLKQKPFLSTFTTNHKKNDTLASDDAFTKILLGYDSNLERDEKENQLPHDHTNNFVLPSIKNGTLRARNTQDSRPMVTDNASKSAAVKSKLLSTRTLDAASLTTASKMNFGNQNTVLPPVPGSKKAPLEDICAPDPFQKYVKDDAATETPFKGVGESRKPDKSPPERSPQSRLRDAKMQTLPRNWMKDLAATALKLTGADALLGSKDPATPPRSTPPDLNPPKPVLSQPSKQALPYPTVPIVVSNSIERLSSRYDREEDSYLRTLLQDLEVLLNASPSKGTLLAKRLPTGSVEIKSTTMDQQPTEAVHLRSSSCNDKPTSTESMPDSDMPLSFPSHYVQEYEDHGYDWGVYFKFNEGTHVMAFNDSSQIILPSHQRSLHYVDYLPHSEGLRDSRGRVVRVRHHRRFYPSEVPVELSKKWSYAVRHFDLRATQGKGPSLKQITDSNAMLSSSNRPTSASSTPPLFVIRYVRKTKGIILTTSDNVAQLIFVDNSGFVLHNRTITYTSKQNQHVSLAVDNVPNVRADECRRRLVYLREMIRILLGSSLSQRISSANYTDENAKEGTSKEV